MKVSDNSIPANVAIENNHRVDLGTSKKFRDLDAWERYLLSPQYSDKYGVVEFVDSGKDAVIYEDYEGCPYNMSVRIRSWANYRKLPVRVTVIAGRIFYIRIHFKGEK